MDWVAGMFVHVAYRAIFAFGQRHLDPLIAPGAAFEIGVYLAIADAVGGDSEDQLFELRLANVARGAGAIGAFDPAGREFELALEFAVVGEEQQSLGIIIEAPDRHQAGQALGQQVIDRLAPFGVARGGEAAGGLVKTVEAGRDGFRDRVAVDGEAVERGEQLRGLGGNFAVQGDAPLLRSEEHTSELQSLMRISYAVFCLKKKHTDTTTNTLKRI